MRKIVAALVVAMFALGSVSGFAADTTGQTPKASQKHKKTAHKAKTSHTKQHPVKQ